LVWGGSSLKEKKQSKEEIQKFKNEVTPVESLPQYPKIATSENSRKIAKEKGKYSKKHCVEGVGEGNKGVGPKTNLGGRFMGGGRRRSRSAGGEIGLRTRFASLPSQIEGP